MTGRFITLEGTEGVGKTSNLAFIEDWLKQHGIDFLVTREPGGTPLGEEVRQLLLGHKHDGMASKTELLLMFAARAEHLESLIKPALAAGTWVLCDRFTDATYAYQGGGRGLDMQLIASLENLVQDDLRPDMTLLLDAPIEVGRERAGKRSEPDRFELEKNAFFDQVRRTYLSLAEQYPERFRVIDAGRELSDVQAQIGTVLHDYLESSQS